MNPANSVPTAQAKDQAEERCQRAGRNSSRRGNFHQNTQPSDKSQSKRERVVPFIVQEGRRFPLPGHLVNFPSVSVSNLPGFFQSLAPINQYKVSLLQSIQYISMRCTSYCVYSMGLELAKHVKSTRSLQLGHNPTANTHQKRCLFCHVHMSVKSWSDTGVSHHWD